MQRNAFFQPSNICRLFSVLNIVQNTLFLHYSILGLFCVFSTFWTSDVTHKLLKRYYITPIIYEPRSTMFNDHVLCGQLHLLRSAWQFYTLIVVLAYHCVNLTSCFCYFQIMSDSSCFSSLCAQLLLLGVKLQHCWRNTHHLQLVSQFYLLY